MATFLPSFKASLSLWKSRFPLAAGSCGRPKCLLTFHICQPVHYSGEFDTSEMSLWQESLSWNENWSKRKKTKERWKCNLYSQKGRIYVSSLGAGRCLLLEPGGSHRPDQGHRGSCSFHNPVGLPDAESLSLGAGRPPTSLPTAQGTHTSWEKLSHKLQKAGDPIIWLHKHQVTNTLVNQ